MSNNLIYFKSRNYNIILQRIDFFKLYNLKSIMANILKKLAIMDSHNFEFCKKIAIMGIAIFAFRHKT